jgi:hypothetical protein
MRKNGNWQCPIIFTFLVVMSGCSTHRLTEPSQTASQQLLISTAIDQAASQLKPTIPPGSKVFVDPSYIDAGASDPLFYPKYTVASIRDALMRQGDMMAEDKKNADIVVEPRIGAESIDHNGFLIGLPAIPIPVPLAGTLSTPEVDLYKSDRQNGVAKIAISAYFAKTGALAASTGPLYGVSEKSTRTILLFFSTDRNDLTPPDIQQRIN